MGGASNLDKLATGPVSSNHQEVLQETIRNFLLSVTKMILPHKKELSIEGTVGVTVDQDKVLLVHITEKLLKASESTLEDEINEKSTHDNMDRSLSTDAGRNKEHKSLSDSCVDRAEYNTAPAPKPLVIEPVSIPDGYRVAPPRLTPSVGVTKNSSSRIMKRKRSRSDLADPGGLTVKRNNGISPHVQPDPHRNSCSNSQKSTFSTTHYSPQITESERPGETWPHKPTSQTEGNSADMLRTGLVEEHSQNSGQYHLRMKRKPRDSSGALTTYTSMEMGVTKTEDVSPLNLSNNQCSMSSVGDETPAETVTVVSNREKSSEADGSLLGMLLTGDLSLLQMQMAGLSGKLSPKHLMSSDRYSIVEKAADLVKDSPLETVDKD